MHPADVRAALQKRFGTVGAFIEAKGLPPTGVSDVLRGRTSKRVREAIEAVLQEQAESIKLDDTGTDADAHRLNAGAR
jgi:hypothetical protein